MVVWLLDFVCYFGLLGLLDLCLFCDFRLLLVIVGWLFGVFSSCAAFGLVFVWWFGFRCIWFERWFCCLLIWLVVWCFACWLVLH